MTKKTDQQEELETTKSIEEAAKEVAHTTKFDTDKEVRQTPEEVKIKRRDCSKVHKGNQDNGTQETSKESQGRSCCSMMPGKKRLERKHIKNFNDIARKCIWMLKKRRRSRKEEWNISRGQETSTS